ncbi:hypothetical protein [Benzoatithermus flavus]|uniref:Uncharacterized protein n=1 Tax=Benzoatithermus flavus TaxID=3108223 RepID=A0ABU8XN30_9PROT
MGKVGPQIAIGAALVGASFLLPKAPGPLNSGAGTRHVPYTS